MNIKKKIYLPSLGVGKDFLDKTEKVLNIKEKNHYLGLDQN